MSLEMDVKRGTLQEQLNPTVFMSTIIPTRIFEEEKK